MTQQKSGNNSHLPQLQKGISKLQNLNTGGFLDDDSDVEEQNNLLNQLQQHGSFNEAKDKPQVACTNAPFK